MSEIKKTNVYYYQIFPGDENMTPEEKDLTLKINDKVIFREREEFKKVFHSDGHVNIYDYKETHGRYVLGTFVYVQTTNIPPSIDGLTNKPAKLKIGDYDGLGYDSSFIYDRKTRILGLESKKPGTSPKAVLQFLCKNFEMPDVIFKDVVLPDEFTKFMNSNEYTRMEMDLAIPNNDMGVLKAKDKNVNRILRFMQDLKGMNAKIVVSNGRSRKRNLDLKDVRQIAQWFSKTNKGENIAKKLRVTGTDVDSGNTHIFDLISKRLITQLEIKRTRTIGNFQIKNKYRQLEGDFLSYREELERLQK